MKARVHIARSGQRLLVGIFILAALLVCFALNGAQANAAGCPNEAIREAQVSKTLPQGTTFLPGCMALELVSPPKKFNQYVEIPDLSANGDRARFISIAALADTPKQGSIFEPYVASRTPSGWVTSATATPPDIVRGSGPGLTASACTYSPDLSRWAMFGATEAQLKVGIMTPFYGGVGGLFGQIGPTMVPFTVGNEGGQPGVFFALCEGASADVSHFFLRAPDNTYLPDIPPPSQNYHVYDAYLDEGVPTLALLAQDKDGVVHGGNCGVAIGSGQINGGSQRAAISPDASRIYFTAKPACGAEGTPSERIMVRTQTPAGPVIEELIESECTRVSPPCANAGSDKYRGASQEGDKALLATPRQLADTDTDLTSDLYLYDASLAPGSRLTQVSAGDNTAPTPGEGAEVFDYADYAGDASRIYFVAKGVLTAAANEAGATAQAGEPNLYLYQRDADYPAGRTVFIATLAANDVPVWEGGGGSAETKQAMAVPRLGPDPDDPSVGGNGRVLVFRSRAALATEDTDGGKADIYRYDSGSAEMELVTAAEPGGEDNGPIDVFPPSSYLIDIGPTEHSFDRWASEDADTIVFTTEEKLDPEDQDEIRDPYIWREGSLSVLPSPPDKEPSPKVSLSGEEVIFISDDRLLPQDLDNANDAYVVRANGGFPIPPPPVICTGETCQGAPSPQPTPVAPSSGAVRQGNVKQSACRKGSVRKRGRCVKKAKRQRKQSKANRKQGGRK